MPIEKLGPYRVEGVLGRGGMGAVYAAVHEVTGERAAVKILAETLADDPNFRERFATEIETLKTLKHRNIVELVGYGEQDGLLFYAMELVEGRSLQEELQEGRVFDWREVTRIAIQICAALKHAHDHGVIHRDLKPANLMYTAGELVKLSDFGIAKLFGATQVTVIGGVIGTVDYMAPEQAEGTAVTARSDLYSLGSVMYALLTKKPPFASKSIAAVIHGLRFDLPQPIRRIVPEVPQELEGIVMQLLEKEPPKRIATARAVGNRLKAMEHALSLDTRIAEPPEEPSAPPDPFGDLGELDATMAPKAPHGPRGTRATSGDLPTAVFTDSSGPEGQSFGIAARPTRGDDAADALDLRDVGEYELTGASLHPTNVPATAAPRQNRFTQVTEDERRAPRWLISWESHEGLWITVGSVVGMIALLAVFALVAWRLMQPASADQVYQRIETAAAEGDIDRLIGAERQIDDFLGRFPEDPRHAEVGELHKDLHVYRMQRRLELRARRVGGADYLSPAEQAFLEAMRVRRNSIALARTRLEHLVDVFGQQPNPPKQTAELVELARHELARLHNSDQPAAADHSEELRKLVTWAEENLSDNELRRFGEGILALYGEQAWAAEIIAQIQESPGTDNRTPKTEN